MALPLRLLFFFPARLRCHLKLSGAFPNNYIYCFDSTFVSRLTGEDNCRRRINCRQKKVASYWWKGRGDGCTSVAVTCVCVCGRVRMYAKEIWVQSSGHCLAPNCSSKFPSEQKGGSHANSKYAWQKLALPVPQSFHKPPHTHTNLHSKRWRKIKRKIKTLDCGAF